MTAKPSSPPTPPPRRRIPIAIAIVSRRAIEALVASFNRSATNA